MTSSPMLSQLAAMTPELRAGGLSALYIFGSAARDPAGPNSDVDLLFEMERGRKFSIVDQSAMQLRLAERLGRPVDLIERAGLRPALRERVESEMIRIF